MRLKLVAITWLATLIFLYRVGLWAIGWHGSCPCLGGLTDALHVSPQAANAAMKFVLLYLLLGGYAALFGSRWRILWNLCWH
jgi:hypothetical protein